ncbi:MAG: hypothetical protein K8H88_34735, partial [Sandaracinaceae bacterium]|nr:hypothetical protein [Sandaracinaceae bacterium]
QTLGLELTDSNDTTYNHEPQLWDTLIDLRQLLMWEGFVFQGQARIAFPTSKASQSASRVLQTGLGLTVTRVVPEAWGLTVAGTFGYRRWWATSNVSRTASPYPGNCFQPSPGEVPVCTQAGAQSTDRDIFIAGLSVTITPIGALSINLSGFYFATYGHELATGVVPINGGTIDVADGSPTHWRAFTYFSLAVGYDFLPWLNVQLGVQNSNNGATLYAPDGSVRAPFSYDTQVFLSGTIAIDGIYTELAGSDDAGLTPEERQRRRQGLARSGASNAM